MGWRQIFPQPVGLLPYPFNFVILPYVDGWADFIDNVLLLKLEELPQDWLFLKHLKEGNIEEAALSVSSSRDDELREYNIALLTGEYRNVEDDILNTLLRAALSSECEVVSTGREDIDALLLYRKAELLEGEGNVEDALSLLDRAIVSVKDISPLFEQVIVFKKAKIIIDNKGANYALVALLEDLYEKLEDTGADFLRADVAFTAGNAYSALGNLQQAVKYYGNALTFFTIERNPFMYGLVNNNMGLAYVSLPASSLEDQMRLAYGIQCFKNALKVFTKEKYPNEWASVTMNYANALQYLPTANPIKNLRRATELYGEVLEFRKSAGDEVGYARVLANMGNALAHLGELEEAEKHLMYALSIFSKYGMKEEVEGVRQILDEIQAVKGGTHG